jgi:hypothetical protein
MKIGNIVHRASADYRKHIVASGLTTETLSMKYFYMKVGKSNSLAEKWLSGDNPLKQPAVVIFFGKSTIDEIKSGKSNPQAKDFLLCSSKKRRGDTLIVVVGDGNCWIFHPNGNVREYKPTSRDVDNFDDLWKMLPVKILSSLPLRDVPPVLAGINANAYLSRGTFREIRNWGNIKAIHSVLKLRLPDEYFEKRNCTASCLLECPSSVELETLVAKLFEAKGCFVPAYRGGYVQDVDLFVRNEKFVSMKMDGLIIPAKSNMTIQVKGWSGLKTSPKNVDCFIAFDAPKFNAEWLLHQVKNSPSVITWLKKSLSWLPSDFLSNYNL